MNAQDWIGADGRKMGAFKEDDNFELSQNGKGVRMRSPNGSRFR